ncbi:hypothetical protein HPB51_022043 [Rhipicephalus microplus]|uniref:Uncharacterized protein n=1 Tax=Rhipicephalus microplus TaxID=6941 RepID=A0A9J6DX16_RHIMP|nr:hypothetical protein HPB51_022043 [Rhipicephalus microplus]
MAQSRTTDPDIPASTTLRSGRVLSNSPPITDGVQASTAAPHHDCSEAISRGFSLFAQELKTSGFGCASFGSFNENEIPYFHGFKDDPSNWPMKSGVLRTIKLPGVRIVLMNILLAVVDVHETDHLLTLFMNSTVGPTLVNYASHVFTA